MRRAVLRLATAIFSVLASQCAAHAWQPERPVRIVVPFSAGGPSDTIARIVASEMQETLSATVYVENIPGAGGTTGVNRFLQTARDGHVLLMGHMGTHGAGPALTPDLGYDPLTDFAPVGLAAGTPMVIAVARGVSAHDLAGLSALMRQRGKDIRVGHAGRGSVSHAAALVLSATLNAEPTLVPYAGTGPALGDLLNGRIDVLVDQIVNLAPAIGAGKARGLAIVGRTRSDALPEVPSTNELGVPMAIHAWNGLFAKAGTPPDQVAALNAALRGALAAPRCRERLLDLGAELPDETNGTPEALGRIVKADVARWSANLFELRN